MRDHKVVRPPAKQGVIPCKNRLSISRLVAKPVIAAFLLGLSVGCLNFGIQGLNPAFGNAGELERFEIKTDTVKKEVNVMIYGDGYGSQSASAVAEKKGNQINITLPNTRLSQGLKDQGMPVVMDNQNKFIGRAVPQKNSNGESTKIILPNVSGQNYKVNVIHQDNRKQNHLLTRLEPAIKIASKPATQSASSQTAVTTSEVYPSLRTTPAKTPQLLAQAQPEVGIGIRTTKAEPTLSMAGVSSEPDELPGVRNTYRTHSAPAEAPASPVSKPTVPKLSKAPVTQSSTVTTRSAVTNLVPQLDILFGVPKENTSQSNKITTNSSPKPTTSNDSVTKKLYRPVIVMPSTAEQNGNKADGIISNENSEETQTQSTASANAARKVVIWNPYTATNIANEIPQFEALNSNPNRSTSSSRRRSNREENRSGYMPEPPNFANQSPQVQAAPQSDPLWYLHQLPAQAGNGQTPPLTQVPDLNQPLSPEAGNGIQLSPNPETTGSTSAIVLDQNLIQGLVHLAKRVPAWAYILLGLFFGGIGLFCLIGAVALMTQLWNQWRGYQGKAAPTVSTTPSIQPIFSPTAYHQDNSSDRLGQETTSQTPSTPKPAFDPTPIAFEDTSSINVMTLMKPQAKTIEEAVHNSVTGVQSPIQRKKSRFQSNPLGHKVASFL